MEKLNVPTASAFLAAPKVPPRDQVLALAERTGKGGFSKQRIEKVRSFCPFSPELQLPWISTNSSLLFLPLSTSLADTELPHPRVLWDHPDPWEGPGGAVGQGWEVLGNIPLSAATPEPMARPQPSLSSWRRICVWKLISSGKK